MLSYSYGVYNRQLAIYKVAKLTSSLAKAASNPSEKLKPQSNAVFLEQPAETGPRSVQQFLQGAGALQADKLTDLETDTPRYRIIGRNNQGQIQGQSQFNFFTLYTMSEEFFFEIEFEFYSSRNPRSFWKCGGVTVCMCV